MNNQPQGGTSVHVLVTGTLPKRAINNSAGGAILVNNVAVGLAALFSFLQSDTKPIFHIKSDQC